MLLVKLVFVTGYFVLNLTISLEETIKCFSKTVAGRALILDVVILTSTV